MTEDTITALAWQLVWTLAFPTLALVRDANQHHRPSDAWQEQLAYKILEDANQQQRRRRKESPAFPACCCEKENWRQSLGYGEITEQTVFFVLRWIRRHNGDITTTTTSKKWCIVDLGSGSGRVLQAALVGSLPVAELIGLELQTALHQQALERTQQWDHTTTKIDLQCADFTRNRRWIAVADLVFCHATVFSDDLMAQVNRLCAHCRPGTYFCLVSRPLRTDTGIFKTLLELPMEMSWGRGTIFIQQRV